jgi:SPP1 gp7 family putative phage head morphogenesis protein
MTKQSKTLNAVHANRGIEAKYRKALKSLIAEMHNSCTYWVIAAYIKDSPAVSELLAQDASVIGKKKAGAKPSREYLLSKSAPSSKMKRTIEGLSTRWTDRFNDIAQSIAETFLNSIFKTSENSFKASLKEAGMTVEFKMTAAVKDAFTASLESNVGLIRTIPAQYLSDVEGAVMRSYATGRDQGALVKELNALYPKNSDRAALIARDQSNKANAVINRTRQLELGITEAKWLHSHAGKTPRPDHLAANGKVYKIAEGCRISGKFVQPGEEINCRCTSRAILPGLG